MPVSAQCGWPRGKYRVGYQLGIQIAIITSEIVFPVGGLPFTPQQICYPKTASAALPSAFHQHSEIRLRLSNVYTCSTTQAASVASVHPHPFSCSHQHQHAHRVDLACSLDYRFL